MNACLRVFKLMAMDNAPDQVAKSWQARPTAISISKYIL